MPIATKVLYANTLHPDKTPIISAFHPGQAVGHWDSTFANLERLHRLASDDFYDVGSAVKDQLKDRRVIGLTSFSRNIAIASASRRLGCNI